MWTALTSPTAKLTAAAVLAGAAVVLWPGGEIEIRTAMSPAIPGRYKHAPSACELNSGEILLVYYSGSGEYGRDTAIYGSRLNRSTGMWSRPGIITDDPDHAEGNPVLWRSPDQRLWLIYPVRYGETWATAQLAAKVSADEGVTWSDAPAPSDREGLMTRARPLTLRDGACLLPVDLNPSTDPEFVSEDSVSFFLRSNRDLSAWEATEPIHSRLGNLQPAVAALEDGRLVAYCRRGGDYFGRADGMLVRSESSDDGRTWSAGVETDFPNPNAPADFLRLASGRLLLVYNNSAFIRAPLTIAISPDGDRSYPYRRDLLGDEYSYPCALQTSDGMIYVFFTAGARSHIKYVRFTEQDITGEPPSTQ